MAQEDQVLTHKYVEMDAPQFCRGSKTVVTTYSVLLRCTLSRALCYVVSAYYFKVLNLGATKAQDFHVAKTVIKCEACEALFLLPEIKDIRGAVI